MSTVIATVLAADAGHKLRRPWQRGGEPRRRCHHYDDDNCRSYRCVTCLRCARKRSRSEARKNEEEDEGTLEVKNTGSQNAAARNRTVAGGRREKAAISGDFVEGQFSQVDSGIFRDRERFSSSRIAHATITSCARTRVFFSVSLFLSVSISGLSFATGGSRSRARLTTTDREATAAAFFTLDTETIFVRAFAFIARRGRKARRISRETARSLASRPSKVAPRPTDTSFASCERD